MLTIWLLGAWAYDLAELGRRGKLDLRLDQSFVSQNGTVLDLFEIGP
jgi:hypothetical protein